MSASTEPRISDELLAEAASHLAAMIARLGARVSSCEIERWKTGLGVKATVNDKAVTAKLQYGIIAWAEVARQLIADAEVQGGVARVM